MRRKRGVDVRGGHGVPVADVEVPRGVGEHGELVPLGLVGVFVDAVEGVGGPAVLPLGLYLCGVVSEGHPVLRSPVLRVRSMQWEKLPRRGWRRKDGGRLGWVGDPAGYSVVGRGFDCSFGFWVGDGRSGTSVSGGGRPAWFSPVLPVVTWQTSEEASPEGVSTTSFSVFLAHSEGWGGVFSAAVAGLMGNLRGETTGEIFSKGHRARGFSAGLLSEERADLMLWTFHRLDG